MSAKSPSAGGASPASKEKKKTKKKAQSEILERNKMGKDELKGKKKLRDAKSAGDLTTKRVKKTKGSKNSGSTKKKKEEGDFPIVHSAYTDFTPTVETKKKKTKKVKETKKQESIAATTTDAVRNGEKKKKKKKKDKKLDVTTEAHVDSSYIAIVSPTIEPKRKKSAGKIEKPNGNALPVLIVEGEGKNGKCTAAPKGLLAAVNKNIMKTSGLYANFSSDDEENPKDTRSNYCDFSEDSGADAGFYEPLALDKKQEGIGFYTPYSPALDIKLENGSESESESNGENLYLNLADDTPSPKPSPAVKGKKDEPEDLKKGMKKQPKEDELTVMIKKANADILKNILVEHSMDHRSHMLSYVTESLAKEMARAKEISDAKGKARDWNAEYQAVLHNGLAGVGAGDLPILAKIGEDFVTCAETYAKIIINELPLSNEHKTIKPANVGGIAGGEKYIVNGMLFKFCLDQLLTTTPEPLWMYGGNKRSDENAMKVGGLELQGLEAWQSQLIVGIHFPIMAVIDYKGFRVVATSLLPLSNDSLIYGSNDGGKTVVASDPKFNALIEQAGKQINLKLHEVGQGVAVYGPGDIEGHKGKDGRFYLLDFARTMPPEAPTLDEKGRSVIPRAVFFRMLRPEIVATNSVPLCSDVFSGWGVKDKDFINSHKEAETATRRIFEESIPTLIKELDALDIDAMSGHYFTLRKVTPQVMGRFLDKLSFPERMHFRGINIRYMGYVRQGVKNKHLKVLLLSMAVARVLKSVLRDKMREIVRSQVISETACKALVAEFFNEMVLAGTLRERPENLYPDDHDGEKRDWFSMSTPTSSRWKDFNLRQELERKFVGILTPEEKAEPWEVFSSVRICAHLILFESLHLEIMVLSNDVLKALTRTSNLTSIRLVPDDIIELCATVRTSHNFNIVKALTLQMEARELLGIPLKVSTVNDFESTLHAARDNYEKKRSKVAEVAGDAPVPFEPSEAAKGQANRLLSKAIHLINLGNLSYGLCPFSPLTWACLLIDLCRTLKSWKKIEKKCAKAMRMFERSRSIGGPFASLYSAWVYALQEFARHCTTHSQSERAEKLLEQADAKLKEAVIYADVKMFSTQAAANAVF